MRGSEWSPFMGSRPGSSGLKFGRETYGCRPYLFALAPDRQPGATRSLNMLPGHPPEIIRKHSRDHGAHVVRFAETSKCSPSAVISTIC